MHRNDASILSRTINTQVEFATSNVTSFEDFCIFYLESRSSNPDGPDWEIERTTLNEWTNYDRIENIV